MTPCTCPDGAAVQRAKDEQHESVQSLKATGLREFDLPVHWLPATNHGDESSAESEAGDGDDAQEGDGLGGHNDGGGGSDRDYASSDSETEEAAVHERGWPRGTGRSANDRKLVHVEEGSFAFFMAREAPFVVGKVIAESFDDDGERGVDLHWLRPTKDDTCNNAASLTLEEYGSSTFVGGYIIDDANGPGRSGKARRMKDVSWEPVQHIVATCAQLRGNGKKIPKRVLKVLRSAMEDSVGSRLAGQRLGGEEREDGIGNAVRAGGSASNGREEERRRGHDKGGNEDGIDDDGCSENTTNEEGYRKQRKEDESGEQDVEKEGLLRGKQGIEGCTDAGRFRQILSRTAVDNPVLEADEGRSSSTAGVRKRPHPTVQTAQPSTRVRLTAAHYRPRRGAAGDIE